MKSFLLWNLLEEFLSIWWSRELLELKTNLCAGTWSPSLQTIVTSAKLSDANKLPIASFVCKLKSSKATLQWLILTNRSITFLLYICHLINVVNSDVLKDSLKAIPVNWMIEHLFLNAGIYEYCGSRLQQQYSAGACSIKMLKNSLCCWYAFTVDNCCIRVAWLSDLDAACRVAAEVACSALFCICNEAAFH